MHVMFIPYGMKKCVDIFIRDMESQKYAFPFTSPDGKKTVPILLEGQVRILPFGIYEHIFPREYKDMVLTTLGFKNKAGDKQPFPYSLGKIQLAFINTVLSKIRKVLGAEKAKDFKPTEQKMGWIQNFVSIIPIGIKDERKAPVTEQWGEYAGWTHEAI